MTYDFSEIHLEASRAAKEAVALYIAKKGEGMCCGFAWAEVVVDGRNRKLTEAFKAIGFSKGWHRSKQLTLWNPSKHNTQSIDVKEAGARAYAETFNQLLKDAYPSVTQTISWNSRVD